MDDVKEKIAVQKFIKRWTGRGQEDEDDRSYWIDILSGVLGVENVTDHIKFQKKVVVDGKTKKIDAYIPETKVLIEQKSLGHSLDKKGLQSDGQQLTPFEQASRYNGQLTYNERARWIVTSNFSEIWIYDMNQPNPQPIKLLLSELEDNYSKLDFLVNQETKKISHEIKISKDAGELVGKLYDTFLKQYPDPESKETLHNLNVLCVRLVFCLYAENSGLFGHNGIFREYMESFETDRMRWALEELFKVLDTPEDERPRHLADDNPKAVSFPYVNGGLFSERDIDIPPFTEEIRELLLDEASAGFNWSDISPTIFGAVFESTLNPETRRTGGMHYTSIENIHKVIDPLFLDDLKAELKEICVIAVERTRNKKLQDFQNKLATLNFLDPACGSGNFLTEAYLSLRHLENEAIRVRLHDQMTFGEEGINPIQVSLGQFYGIEINDFAVSVAKTALWIAESQMIKETKSIVVSADIPFLPLESYANIVEGNALQMNWEDVIPKSKLSYIMGNPPFSGARIMSSEQKKDVNTVFSGWKNVGNLDYVSCWYKKASDLMKGTTIHSALVSTNSVSQGENVANLWKPLMESGVHIDFAHRTFRWDSEASIKAHVHCVIIGFSTASNTKPKVIYTDSVPQIARNINGYLIDAGNVFISSRSKPICDVPIMSLGNQPIDGGNYLFSKEEKDEFLKKEPNAEPYFRPWIGSKEFINRTPRYFLYLRECSPDELRKLPECCKRVNAVKDYRQSSNRPDTRKLADTPREFAFTNISQGTFIVVPEVSSEKRRYIPIGFMTPDVLCSNLVKLVPNTTIYHFGILESNVHMAWVRTVCGRLKSDYRYSNTLVYNNFPWPNPTSEQKEKIGKTAQAILDARALYPDSSLADLYDKATMPPELQKAHQQNNKAVMEAYGFTKDTEAYSDEDACVAELMKMYQKLTEDK